MIKDYLEIFNNLTLLNLILLIAFGVLFLVRFLFLFLFTGKFLFRRKKHLNGSEKEPLSLILAVRNEEENLKNNLPKILSDKSQDFELIAVDDFSQDNSYLVMGLLKEKFKNFKISALNQDTRFSVKLAQNIAIKAASNDWVLPFPVSLSEFSAEWLSEFSRSINDELNVVVAFVNVNRARGFFNHLYRIENYFMFLKSAGYILNGLSFVYAEENVAFKKEQFFKKGGYGQKIKEPYANLELIINSFINKRNTYVLFNPTSTIRSNTIAKRKEYLDLLKKSFRIEQHLSLFKRIFLAFDDFTRLLFLPVSVVVFLLNVQLWIAFISLLSVKILAHLFIIKISQNRLKERKIYVSSLIYELIVPYFKLFYKWNFNRQSRKNKWRSNQ